MRKRLILSLLVLAVAACDRVTSPSHRDAGPDSLASEWERVDAGTVNYNSVSGSDPNNVIIVGDQGSILRWDGLSLQREESGTVANLRSVFVVDEAHAYAVGEQGTILSREAGAWVLQPPLTSVVLNAVAAGASYVVAAGEQGKVLMYSGGMWRQPTNEFTDNYYALSDSNDGVVAVGSLGAVRLIDLAGSLRPPNSITGYTKVLAGAARFKSGAYVGGVDGGLFYWDGSKGTRIDGLPQKFVRAISIDKETQTAWIVGHEGLVAYLPNGGSPVVVPTPDDRWLLGVYAASASDVWIVGRSGLILRGPPGVRGKDGGVP